MLKLFAAVLLLAQFGENPNERMGKAARIGVDLERVNGILVIQQVTPGSSAETAGLKVGDQILRIDMDNAERFSEGEALAALRGLWGTKTTLTVLPRAQMLPKRVDVSRDVRVYMDHAHSSPMDPSEVMGAIPEVGAQPLIEAAVVDVTFGGLPASPEMRDSFGRGAADVATCVGALSELLPADLPEVRATFTVKRETITVRTEPISGDLSSCLGRKAVGWKLPLPGGKDDPHVFVARWTITKNAP